MAAKANILMSTQLKETLIDHYQPHPGVYDEMCTPEGEVRAHWQYLASALADLGQGDLTQRRNEVKRLLRENGVTYNVYNDTTGGGQRPWALDLFPLLIPSEEWESIESGLSQRAEVLNLILQDLYGPRDLIRRGLLPPELIYDHPGFLRPCYPLHNTRPHSLILYAADLARGPDGRMWVLSDRTQAPSGAGYALENRMVMSRVFPSLYRDSHVHRLALFFQNLRASLASFAPRQDGEPRIVVLTPGALNETYFEHAYLANYLGYNLARGDDLSVRDGRVWLRSLNRMEPVDVILRRVDDHYCDPLHLYAKSRLGIPGLVEAVQRGNVTVANPLGASLLENPALHAFLQAIAQHFLGHPLELPSVATWWCGQKQERSHVIANIGKMVVRTTYRLAGGRPVYGALLSHEERRELTRRILARPYSYVGQECLDFSRAPIMVNGSLTARHVVLRAFLAARDDGYVVMPGGLTRVSPSDDSFIVSNQAGGIAKDTWVLASEPEKQVSLLHPATTSAEVTPPHMSLPPRTVDNLFWFARYAERAEHSLRLMRTVLAAWYSTGEFEGTYNPETLTALLQALTHATATYPGFAGPRDTEGPVDTTVELLSLIAAPGRQGGIAYNLRGMLHAANAVRNLLSSDTLRLINDIQERLAQLEQTTDRDLANLQQPLNDLITALAALTGLLIESMMRGEAWMFLDIGRRLERALLLIALVRGTLTMLRSAETESALLTTILGTCECFMAYRRGHNVTPEIVPALTLLLVNDANPRALMFQLVNIEKHIANLPHDPDVPDSGEKELSIMDAITAVRLSKPPLLAQVDAGTGLRSDLDQLLARVDHLLRVTSDALSKAYIFDTRGQQRLLGMEPPP
jgi:uncharacterized circularly permuted ATP-grasp superfamily protein/uncharacterized alpha-E superfamily protein